jgi:hypothetical protein
LRPAQDIFYAKFAPVFGSAFLSLTLGFRGFRRFAAH